jgi:mannose-6-phosphate isomerase-like protein (cupin superfamily)
MKVPPLRPGLVFQNPLQGMEVRVLETPDDTAGTRFRLEVRVAPFRGEGAVAEHLHTTARERFRVLAGRARYRLGGVEGELSAGESIDMPAGIAHVHPWNIGSEELVFEQEGHLDPPDREKANAALIALATLFGLAREGKVNAAGLPNLLQLAVIVTTTMPATFVTSVPMAAQRLLFPALAAVGRGLGYRPWYARHWETPER